MNDTDRTIKRKESLNSILNSDARGSVEPNRKPDQRDVLSEKRVSLKAPTKHDHTGNLNAKHTPRTPRMENNGHDHNGNNLSVKNTTRTTKGTESNGHLPKTPRSARRKSFPDHALTKLSLKKPTVKTPKSRWRSLGTMVERNEDPTSPESPTRKGSIKYNGLVTRQGSNAWSKIHDKFKVADVVSTLFSQNLEGSRLMKLIQQRDDNKVSLYRKKCTYIKRILIHCCFI